MRFYVSRGDAALVDVNVQRIPADLRAEYIAQIKGELAEAFGNLWDTAVTVATEEETAAAEVALLADAQPELEASP